MTKKVSPETGCDKEPVELCAPRGCGFVNVSTTGLVSHTHHHSYVKPLQSPRDWSHNSDPINLS